MCKFEGLSSLKHNKCVIEVVVPVTGRVSSTSCLYETFLIHLLFGTFRELVSQTVYSSHFIYTNNTKFTGVRRSFVKD